MFVRTINISRDGDYGSYGRVDPTKPLLASITIDGQHGEVKLRLSPEMSKRIVEIVADEVAAAGRATAEAMVADVLTVKALPDPEAF